MNRGQTRRPCRQAGVIAAGDGARLRASHPETIKPLIPLSGTPLCHWIVSGLVAAGVNKVTFLHNSRGRAVRKSLTEAFPVVAFKFVEADTASSWESFRMACGEMPLPEPFLMSTVDALVPPREVRRFAETMEGSRARTGLALTDFIDDEKPLWADLSEDGRVTGLGERSRQRKYCTSGLYFLTPEAVSAMPGPSAYGSLREFWASLVRGSAAPAGLVVGTTMDVDRPEDVRAAQEYLRSMPWSVA